MWRLSHITVEKSFTFWIQFIEFCSRSLKVPAQRFSQGEVCSLAQTSTLILFSHSVGELLLCCHEPCGAWVTLCTLDSCVSGVLLVGFFLSVSSDIWILLMVDICSTLSCWVIGFFYFLSLLCVLFSSLRVCSKSNCCLLFLTSFLDLD